MKDVLVVEDNPLVREIILSCLSQLRARVRTTTTAEEAIVAIRASKPDLVLCDVLLPGRSGVDLIGHLRAHAMTRELPVIAVTTLSGADSANKLRAAGFTDVIGKPVDPVTFVAQIGKRLK